MAKPDRGTPNGRPPTPPADDTSRPARPALASSFTSERERKGIQGGLSQLNLNATLVAATAAVLLVVLGLVSYGFWNNYIRPARATAVQVGNRTYDTAYLTRRVKYAVDDNPVLQPAQLATLPVKTANDIIDEEVLLQSASNLGVSVSDAEIDGSLAETLKLPFTSNDEGVLQSTQAFQLGVRDRLAPSGLTLAEFRRSVHGQRLRDEVRKYYTSQVPASAPQARVRVITTAAQDKADDARKQVTDGGIDMATLATSVSTDSSRSAAGLREWSPRGAYPDAVADQIFSLPVGQLSDVIKADDKFWLVRVEEREDNRDLTDQQKTDIGRKGLDDFLAKGKKDLNARAYADKTDIQSYVLDHSGAIAAAARNSSTTRPPLTVPRVPTAPAVPVLPSPAASAPVAPAATPAAAPSPAGGTP